MVISCLFTEFSPVKSATASRQLSWIWVIKALNLRVGVLVWRRGLIEKELALNPNGRAFARQDCF